MNYLGRVRTLVPGLPGLISHVPLDVTMVGPDDEPNESDGRQTAGQVGTGAREMSVTPDAGSDPVQAVVSSMEAFELSDFEDRNDQFKNELFLPQPVLDRLFPAEHSDRGYVEASIPGRSETEIFYVAPFGANHTPETDQNGLYRGFLRSNLQERIGGDPQNPTTQIELTPVEVPETRALTVTRFSTHIETTENALCHVNPVLLESLGVESGETVEVFNPETGARIWIEVRETTSLDENHVALSTHVRKLLRVSLPEAVDDSESAMTELRLRKPEHDIDSTLSLWDRVTDWIFKNAVDYHAINLRVFPAPNTDENRNIARLNEETMRLLGIDDGDKIIVSSYGGQKSVRCLLASEDSYLIDQDVSFRPGDVSDRNILLPATEREAIETIVHDVVQVRRDPSYVAGKRIVPSLFSLLGVYVGGTQLLALIAPNMDEVLVLAILSVLSAITVWIVLWPERQKCR